MFGHDHRFNPRLGAIGINVSAGCLHLRNPPQLYANGIPSGHVQPVKPLEQLCHSAIVIMSGKPGCQLRRRTDRQPTKHHVKQFFMGKRANSFDQSLAGVRPGTRPPRELTQERLCTMKVAPLLECVCGTQGSTQVRRVAHQRCAFEINQQIQPARGVQQPT